MSATRDGLDSSIWTGIEGREKAPKRCPHCKRELAHPDDLRNNDSIEAMGLFSAWRRHREAHYGWGDDPHEHGDEYGDPYLGTYYDTNRDAVEQPDDEPTGDPEETVGHVYEVTICYEARKTAKVVATDKHRAKEKVKYDELPDGEDLTGHTPRAERTHELHDTVRKVKSVERQDEELAERMAGWPW
jgi:hypothetical protein